MKFFSTLFFGLFLSVLTAPAAAPVFVPNASYRVARHVTADFLNLRSTPSATGGIVGKVFPLNTYNIIALGPVRSVRQSDRTSYWASVAVEGWLEVGQGGTAGGKIRREGGTVRVLKPVIIQVAEETGALAEFPAGSVLQFEGVDKAAPNWIYVRKSGWMNVGSNRFTVPFIERKNPRPGPGDNPPSGGALYTVKRGDTFFGIASRYRITVQALAAANPLVNPSLIQVGQRLIVPRS